MFEELFEKNVGKICVRMNEDMQNFHCEFRSVLIL